jgi:hypothetical protein
MKTHKRQTGRTTRMMKLAIKLAREGRAVYVMFRTKDIGDAVQKTMLPQLMADGPPVRIKFETPGSLETSFSLERMELRTAHPNCVVLVDHYVIESRFGRLLETWTQFDSDLEYVRADEIRRALGGHRCSMLWSDTGLIAATMRCVDALCQIEDLVTTDHETKEDLIQRVRGILGHNVKVDLPDTAAQDSASKTNNPAVSG